MTDMRVKMILDLVANTKGGAAQAKRDLASVKGAAKSLDGSRGGQRIKRDILDLTPASKNAARSLRDVKVAADGIGQSTGAAKQARDLDKLRASAARARAEMKGLKNQQTRDAGGKFSKDGEGGTKGSTSVLPGARGLVGGYLGIQGARMAARATVGQSISFEKAMAEVRKKVDGMDDPAEMQKMEALINRSAIVYGRKREEVAGLVAEAGAGGVSRGDMPEFMRINLAAATAWDVSADKAGNALAKIRAATQWTNPQLEDFTDKVNALSDAGAAKEMDVVDMFQRAGAAAKAAGVEFDTSLAFLTAMNNVAIAPEVAARGFNAFASKLRTATDQGDKVEEGLKMLGLTPKGVEKGMKTNAATTMIDVLERLEKNGDKAKAAIKIFGKEWWDEIARAGQALPEIRKNLDIVATQSKWKGSAQNSLNIQLATTDNHLERLKAQVSEIGDRLGRWALPPINEAIEKLIAGMDALDKRAAEKKETGEIAGKLANGQPLTAEEREKLANDRQMAASAKRQANQISAKKDFEDTSGRIVGTSDTGAALSERAQLLRRQLERQISTLETELKLTPDGMGDRRKTMRLKSLRQQLTDIPTSPFDRRAPQADARRPADQDERGRPDRVGVMALKERITQLESRLAILDELKKLSPNKADRDGFSADEAPVLARRAQAEGSLRRKLAPDVSAGGNFGFGPGGAPESATPRGAGPGLLSFKTSAKGAAQSIKDAFTIDLGEAGVTMMERLNAGISSGQGTVTGTAAGVGDAVKGALTGIDLTAAGQAAMSSYAAGLRAGAPAAVAAAQSAASQVKGALGSGGRKSISGALHDGVE